MGTTVSIQPPTYVDAIIAVQYTKLTQYTDAEVQTGIKYKIVTEFGYGNQYFQQTITPQNIEYQLARVPGVLNAKVTGLHRQGGSGLALQQEVLVRSSDSWRQISVLVLFNGRY
jgi:asparagine N-glycosylation enzyme membrane subunit Stt3